MKSALQLVLALLLACLPLRAQWIPLGPDGGDVRSLAYDPHNPDRIVLGTSAGQLFLSTDGGNSWSRWAQLGDGDDYVLDHVAFDPSRPGTIYASAWSVVTTGGDLFRSTDDGKTWRALAGMHGKSIRAMTLAPSDSSTIVVGALDGVFRSHDRGDTWDRISPPNHAEIKNIESVAVDPKHPDVIYAGTWHLPWKTDDGGRNWHSIKKGVIDDSDVFSIIIDHLDSSIVYASACSGIYKSEIAGELFHKIQGIPATARRTRVLQQDPLDPLVVYAGTTEGLWKTTDGGKTFRRLTDGNVIVNDVLIDPRNPQRVLLATDRIGIYASNDGGKNFSASNHGFSHRQVAAVLADSSEPDTFYAGVVNDRDFGGMFVTRDAGAHWAQISAGLYGRDIFSLRQGSNGELLAGTNTGVYALRRGSREWEPINLVLTEKALPARRVYKSKPAPIRHEWVKSELNARVAQVAVSSGRWFAATNSGVFRSLDSGHSWNGGAILGHTQFVAVDVLGDTVAGVTPSSLLVSHDGGSVWFNLQLPAYITAIYGVTLAPESLWISTREGAFVSRDKGSTWEHLVVGPPARQIGSIAYDAAGGRLLAVTSATGEIFESADNGRTFARLAETHWPVRRVAIAGRRLLGLTVFDGIVAAPLANAPAGAAVAGTNH